MQAESEAAVALPPAREHKLGFMSRRRRLRNRWNIHMRKDERAEAKAWPRDDALATSIDSPAAIAAQPLKR